MPNRRQCLKGIAGGLGTVAAVTETAGATQGRRDPWNGVRKEPPSEDVDFSRVSPYPNFEGDDDIPAGNWLDYTVGLVNTPAYESSPEGLRRELEESELRFSVDGEQLQDVKAYFGDPVFDEETGRWVTWFDAYTPPRAPGEYTAKIYAYNPAWETPTAVLEGTHRVVSGRE